MIPIIVRYLAGIEGTTDYDSAAYGAGKITGIIESLVPMALQGAAAYSAAAVARGAPSVLNANRYFRIGPGVGWGGTMYFAIAGISYELGAPFGSAISALPVPGQSDSLRDWLADKLIGNLGPKLSIPELDCGW